MVGKGQDDARRYPKVDVKNDALFIALKLAEAGFYGGDPDKIMKAPATTILEIIRYRAFQKEWDAVYSALNPVGDA